MQARASIGVALVGIALTACAQRASDQAPVAFPVVSTPAHSSLVSADEPAPPPPAPSLASACDPLGPGQTSDDEAPTVRGTSGDADMVEWFQTHGVSRDQLFVWLTSHYGQGLTKEHSEVVFDGSRCGQLRVGDQREEALVCVHSLPMQIMPSRAITLVVRNKRPEAVLDVGVGLVAMDFPDARWLDLALVMAPDGNSAVLEDRAPDGTVLVEPRSRCMEREKREAECARKLAAHPDPESLAHKDLQGERIDLLDGCPLLRGEDGRIVVFRSERSWDSMAPSTLHDCTGAQDALHASMRDLGQAPAESRQMMQEALAFANKACGQRGRYAWEKGRFVKVGR